jgi:hypothetical protein
MNGGYNYDGAKVKNVTKMSILLVLALVVILYSVLLFSGMLGKKTSEIPVKSADPQALNRARAVMDDILTKNKAGFVKEYVEAGGYLTLKVDRAGWKSISIKDKKKFLGEMASARATLGLSRNIKVIDARTSTEYASFENNRATLDELDF